MPNVQALRLVSRQLNAEILDWVARASSGRHLSLFLSKFEQNSQGLKVNPYWSAIAVSPHRNLGLLMMPAFSISTIQIVTTMVRLKTIALLLGKRDAPLHVIIDVLWEARRSRCDWVAVEDLLSSYNRPNLSQYRAFGRNVEIFRARFYCSNGRYCVFAFQAVQGYSSLRIQISQSSLAELVNCIKNQKQSIGTLIVKVVNYNTSLRKLKKMMRPLKEIRVTVGAEVVCVKKGSMLIGSWKKKYEKVLEGVREAMMSDVVGQVGKK